MVKSERQNFFKGMCFISPWVIGFLAFTLIPVALAVYYSLCDHNLLQRPLLISGENYREIFHDAVFWKSLKVTFGYAAMAIPASLLVSLGLALLLNMKIPGQAIFRTIIFLPSLIPTMAAAMLWLYLFNAKIGLFNVILTPVENALNIDGHLARMVNWINHVPWMYRLLGGQGDGQGVGDIRPLAFPPHWLEDDRLALMALAFMSVWGVGYTVVIFLAGLQDVPRELYEAAEIDGASPLRRLWHVTLPMLSPVIFFNLIMAIIGTFQVLAVPYAMTTGGPDKATYFYSMFVFDSAFRNMKMGYASALGLIQLAIILGLTGIAFWTSKRWVHYQGK